jgi:hypothetical protein
LSNTRNPFIKCFTCLQKKIRSTHIDFAENEIFPNSISFSLLFTAHPNILQHIRVRSFLTQFLVKFYLAIIRSSGFASNKNNFTFIFKIPKIITLNLLILLSRWSIIQKVRCHTKISTAYYKKFQAFSHPIRGFS